MQFLLFKLCASKSNNFLSNHQMIFSKIGVQLQITIITIKNEHMNIENIRFILHSRAYGGGKIAECMSIFIVIVIIVMPCVLQCRDYTL